jgi:hypothetical protein
MPVYPFPPKHKHLFRRIKPQPRLSNQSHTSNIPSPPAKRPKERFLLRFDVDICNSKKYPGNGVKNAEAVDSCVRDACLECEELVVTFINGIQKVSETDRDITHHTPKEKRKMLHRIRICRLPSIRML